MQETEAWDKFIHNCQRITTFNNLKQFLELTLTPAECKKIAARYMILNELVHGNKTHRELAAQLKVSIFNITRGANQLKITAKEIQQLIIKAEE